MAGERFALALIAVFAIGIGTVHWFGGIVPRTESITVLTWRSADAVVLDTSLSSRRFGLTRTVWRAEALVQCPPPVTVVLVDFASESEAERVLDAVQVGATLRVWCAPDAEAGSNSDEQATLPNGPHWHWFSGFFAYALAAFCLWIALFAPGRLPRRRVG